MSASTRLSHAVKALCFLARTHPEAQNSATISAYTGVNASKLRKLLADIARIGVVTTAQGAGGGYLLARLPREIHLQEIYCAIEDRKAFHLDVASEARHDEAAAINAYFLGLFSDIQVEIEEKMRAITLEDILKVIAK